MGEGFQEASPPGVEALGAAVLVAGPEEGGWTAAEAVVVVLASAAQAAGDVTGVEAAVIVIVSFTVSQEIRLTFRSS